MGDKYVWMWPYILSDCNTAPVTAVRWDNPVALSNPVMEILTCEFLQHNRCCRWLYVDLRPGTNILGDNGFVEGCTILISPSTLDHKIEVFDEKLQVKIHTVASLTLPTW